MKNYLLLSAAALTILALGCVQPPDYPIEPVIEYVGLTKNTMLQGKTGEDETYITISFTDGDGDIGFFQEGSSMVETDLFLRDLRTDSEAAKFSIPFVPELGTTNGISGEITFRLLTTCCVFPEWVTDVQSPCDPSMQYPVDTPRYEIYIRDRAGHESNRIETEDIYLLCQ